MMKKYWNLLSLFGVFLMTALLLTACSSDDDSPDGGRSESSAIVGEWACFDYGSNGRWMFMEMVNFKRNGTFTSVSYYVEGKNLDNDNATINNIEKDKISGTYTVSNGVITLTADGDTWEKEYSIKSDRLIIYDDDGNMYYDIVTDEIEEMFEQMEQWYRLLNNNPVDDDDPVWGGGGQGSNELVGEWVGTETQSNGRYIYMEKIAFKNDGTYIVTSYAIHGKNLDTGGTIEQVDKLEEGGKYRVSNGILTLTSSQGETATASYKVDETSLTLTAGEVIVMYQRMDDKWKQFVDVVELVYQATHNH
jgi:major membrane immunogen (membrane-anchored lipoprotein)